MNESEIIADLYGGLATSKSLEELLAVLAPTFPQACIRESCHYKGGRYVSLEFGDHDRICFERDSDSEHVIHCDGGPPEQVLEIVERLAKVLEAADIIHRFEVYQNDELLSGTSYQWEEAETIDRAPMVTVSQYSRIEDAQKDAARLSKRGIRTAIVHAGGGGGLIAGTGPSLELQVDARDVEKMRELEDEIEDEINSERPHQCPKCGSKNYEPHLPVAEGIFGALSVLIRGKTKAMDDYLNYRCNDCHCYFRVRVT